MLNDNEKKALAKKNLQEFYKKMEKMSKEQDKPLSQRRMSYVFYKGTAKNKPLYKEDYFWTDHTITPTGFWRWINTYNKSIEAVIVDDTVFNELISMIDNATTSDTLQFGDVTVMPNRLRGKVL